MSDSYGPWTSKPHGMDGLSETQPLSAASGETLDAATLRGVCSACGEVENFLCRNAFHLRDSNATGELLHPAQQLKACECLARKACQDTRSWLNTAPLQFSDGDAHEPQLKAAAAIFALLDAALNTPCPCEGLRARLAYIEDSYERAESDVNRQSKARFDAEAERDSLRTELAERTTESLSRLATIDSLRLGLTASQERERKLREQVRVLRERALQLTSAMETCHICQTTLLVDDGPIHCEDGCSYECEDHDSPACESIADLHASLKSAAALATPETKEKP